MQAREVAQEVESGNMTMDQAMALWDGQENAPESRVEHLIPEAPRGIQHAPLRIPDILVEDRKQLARVRRDLALVVESTSVQHEYERQMVEEKARHITALPIIAVMGIADGALEGVGYSISEVAETFTYTATRTLRRIKEGWERGKNQ